MPIQGISSNAPSSVAEEVTNSDTVNFTNGVCRTLYTGSGGDITVIMDNDVQITFAGTLGGSSLPIACKRVMATGTTPTDLVALF